MQTLNRTRVRHAKRPSPWDFSNKVLYDLCLRHPKHIKAEVVLAKMMLIGRSYAAAIERGRSMEDESINFYIEVVAPSLQRSEIDQWIADAKAVRLDSPSALLTMVRIHEQVTRLFHEISGKEKRSLASKYLHFHVPKLFYIYDSRAAQAVRELSTILPRAAPGLSEFRAIRFA